MNRRQLVQKVMWPGLAVGIAGQVDAGLLSLANANHTNPNNILKAGYPYATAAELLTPQRRAWLDLVLPGWLHNMELDYCQQINMHVCTKQHTVIGFVKGILTDAASSKIHATLPTDLEINARYKQVRDEDDYNQLIISLSGQVDGAPRLMLELMLNKRTCEDIDAYREHHCGILYTNVPFERVNPYAPALKGVAV